MASSEAIIEANLVRHGGDKKGRLMKAKRFPLLVGLLALLGFAISLTLSACGAPAGGAPAGSPAAVSSTGSAAGSAASASAPARQASPAPAGAAGQEFKVTVRDNTFPKEIRVKAGSTVVFVVTNEERAQKHSFELPDFSLYQEVGPRETIRIEWAVPDRKGRWDMGCYLTEPSDAHDGMVGELIIE